MPYALKAGDGETVGGHPLTDFVLSTTASGGHDRRGQYECNGQVRWQRQPARFHVGILFTSSAAAGDCVPTPSAEPVQHYRAASGVTPYAFRAINALTVGQTNNFPQNQFSSIYSGIATQGYIYGLVNNVQKTGTGPISNAYGVLSSVQNLNASGVIGNAYAFVAQTPVTTGIITNSYGFYAEDPNSMNFFAGKVGIGTTTPQAGLDILNVSAPASGVSPNGFRAVGNITLGQINNFPQNNFSSINSGGGTQGYIYGLVNNVQKTGTGRSPMPTACSRRCKTLTPQARLPMPLPSWRKAR